LHKENLHNSAHILRSEKQAGLDGVRSMEEMTNTSSSLSNTEVTLIIQEEIYTKIL
jgi:hypothetical protein